jgi:hypothetical protein
MIQKQLKLNFNHCIFDHFIIPENDDWMWELKKRKEEADKKYNIIKKICENAERR